VEHGLGRVRAAGGEVVPLAAHLPGAFGGAQLHGGGDDGVGREVGDMAARQNQEVAVGAAAAAGHDREGVGPFVDDGGRCTVVDDPAERAPGRGCLRGTGGRLMWWWVTWTRAPASCIRCPMASAACWSSATSVVPRIRGRGSRWGNAGRFAVVGLQGLRELLGEDARRSLRRVGPGRERCYRSTLEGRGRGQSGRVTGDCPRMLIRRRLLRT
jgi:hypothetical protein